MANIFSDLVENVQTAQEDWSKIMTFLQTTEGSDGAKFNQQADVPGTERKLGWFDERVTIIFNLIDSLTESRIDSDACIPSERVNQFKEAAQRFGGEIADVAEIIRDTETGMRKISHLDPNNWSFRDTTDARWNFASYLQNFKNLSDELLEAYYHIAPIVEADKIDVFANAVREIAEKLASIRKDADSVSQLKKQAQDNVSTTEKQKEQANKERDKVSNSAKKARELLTELKTANESGQSRLDQINDASNNADSLKSKVDTYYPQFQQFQSDLDDRNDAFNKLNTNVEELYAALSKKDEQINALIEDKNEQISKTINNAEEMLTGATNAGLAKVFSDERGALDKKLWWAYWGFYFSIFLLFLPALPIVLYLFNIPLKGLEELWRTLTLSLLLAFPIIWLTRFSAARHYQLFQLREYYQYKYSLAMSVEGFKKQTPKYQDEIAAGTFFNLLFNPGDKLTGKDTANDHPNPFLNRFMDKLGLNAEGKQSERKKSDE